MQHMMPLGKPESATLAPGWMVPSVKLENADKNPYSRSVYDDPHTQQRIREIVMGAIEP